MKTYFTFGFNHIHKLKGVTLDCDVVLCIEANSQDQARKRMFDLFDDKWAFEYREAPEMRYFPRGVIYLDEII